jgi:hypothetical protein
LHRSWDRAGTDFIEKASESRGRRFDAQLDANSDSIRPPIPI